MELINSKKEKTILKNKALFFLREISDGNYEIKTEKYKKFLWFLDCDFNKEKKLWEIFMSFIKFENKYIYGIDLGDFDHFEKGRFYPKIKNISLEKLIKETWNSDFRTGNYIFITQDGENCLYYNLDLDWIFIGEDHFLEFFLKKIDYLSEFNNIKEFILSLDKKEQNFYKPYLKLVEKNIIKPYGLIKKPPK